MGEIDSIYNQMQGYLQKAQLGMLNQYNQGNLMHQMDQLKGMNQFYGGTKKSKDWNFAMDRPMTNTEWLDKEIFKYSIKL